MDRNENPAQGNVITLRKILENVKRYWWFCLIPILICGIVVYRDTMNTYHYNQTAAQKDQYIASALIYFPTEDEETGKGNMVIFTSSAVIERAGEIMEESGFEPFDEGTDSLEVGHTMGSYGITLIGEGEERMLCMGEAFAVSMLDVLETATGMSGYIVDHSYVRPCMVDASGSTIIYSDVSQKQVSLSLRDFLSWRNLMILCAGIFVGLALIFVAVLFDTRIRSVEEMNEICSLPCMGVISRKKPEEKKLFFTLSDTMCHDRGCAELTLAAVSSGKDIAGLASEMKESGYETSVSVCDQLMTSAESLQKCRDCKAVVVAVCRDHDKVADIRRALSNLQLMQADVLGYIMIN